MNKKQIEYLQKIEKAARFWRKEYVDQSDINEMLNGCKCGVCTLIKAIDEVDYDKRMEDVFKRQT